MLAVDAGVAEILIFPHAEIGGGDDQELLRVQPAHRVEEDEDEERDRHMQQQGKWDCCFVQRLIAALIIIGACVSLVVWLAYTIVSSDPR
jgi:hypothetical protein